MPVSKTLPALALCLAAPPGFAGCPTGADMARGIVLVQNQPFFIRSDFEATPDGFVEERLVDVDGRKRASTATYRHGLVLTAERAAAGAIEIVYPDPIAPVDALPEAGRLTLGGRLTGPRGEAPVDLVLDFIGHGSVALAECAYDTWTVASSLTTSDGAGARLQVEYSPELNIVLAAGQLEPDGTVTPAYAYQWAGTAADVAR